jgi:hypothetical protein
MNHRFRICVFSLVATWGAIVLATRFPPAATAALASGSPAQRLLDEIFVNLQIVDVVDGVAAGYLDVQSAFGDGLTEADATAFFDAFAAKADDTLPFFTDKPVSKLTLNIIRITDTNQYNVGLGFEKVGDAVLTKQADGWRVSEVLLTKKPK